MKIEVWSDFVCPFCYIGKRRLEAALKALPSDKDVKVSFKSFELDPTAEANSSRSVHEVLAEKYRIEIDEAKKMTDNMVEQAAAEGLTFRFDEAKRTNTFDAHRLAKFAEAQGKDGALTERLLKAYFTDALHIGDSATLQALGEEVGLKGEEIEAVLSSDAYSKEVRDDEEMARQLQIQGVPFFVINQKYAISGAQPTEVFIRALTKVIEEEQPVTTLEPLGESEGNACMDDQCELPTKP